MGQVRSNIGKKSFKIRRAELNLSSEGYKMSPMGEELMRIAMEIQDSDEPAMSEADIEERIRMGRGGFDWEDSDWHGR
jgi:hypothetical protein